jgi:hypothetical protein
MHLLQIRSIGLMGLVFLALGCGGEKGVVVEGSVVKGGAPVKLAEGEGVTITLTNGETKYTTNVGENGTFSIQKPAGGPIALGKYKIHYVHYQSPSPYTRTVGFKRAKDLPTEWEVSDTNHTFTLELDAK